MRTLTYPLPFSLLRTAAVAAAAAGLLTARPVAGAHASEDKIRRVLTLLAAVGEEYREGIRDGAVVRPIEFDEARTFLDDARERFSTTADNLPTATAETVPLFDEVRTAIDGKAAPDSVAEKLNTLRQRIAALSGVSEQVYPEAAPSAARGHALFDQYCATCHGERGDGNGPSAARLNPAPANFTDAQFMRTETPYDFYHVISLGKTHTAMPAWDGVLSVQERWDLVSYVWTLAAGRTGVAEGQGIYLTECASCHGASGNGRGPFAPVLTKAAPDLSQPQTLARRTDADLFAAATDGIAVTSMPSFARTLREDERWKAVAFLRLLSLGGPEMPPAVARGGGAEPQRFGRLVRLLGRCYEHAWTGTQLTNPVEYDEATALAQTAEAGAEPLAQALQASTPDAATKIRQGAAAISAQVRERAPVAAVLASVDALATLADSIGPTAHGLVAAESSPADAALREGAHLLDAAVTAYERGNSEATSLAADAYLEFEPLEPRLGATDPGLKTQIEDRFLQFRQALRTPGNHGEVKRLAARVHDDFAAARTALQPHASPYGLFAESAGIILREGFEIVLVIGALIAYVAKTGNAVMRRAIYAGTAAGVVASLATALIMGEVLQSSPGSSEVLEGITMLLAAAVLFWVSYWLISKTEADRWQRYIRSKVQGAVSGGRGMALASAAFLAVYREGFEMVLFYQALYASAPAASFTLTSGLVAGAIVLLVVYVLFRRFEVQIPIQQFFFVTGLFLYAMAAIFAGQGIHELQEIGVIATTPVRWVPVVPLLGLYPSLQSLAAQGAFVALLLYATVLTLRRRRTAVAHAETAADARALRDAIEALRAEFARLELSGAAPLDARVEGVLSQVEEVAARHGLKPPLAPAGNGGGQRTGH